MLFYILSKAKQQLVSHGKVIFFVSLLLSGPSITVRLPVCFFSLFLCFDYGVAMEGELQEIRDVIALLKAGKWEAPHRALFFAPRPFLMPCPLLLLPVLVPL